MASCASAGQSVAVLPHPTGTDRRHECPEQAHDLPAYTPRGTTPVRPAS